MLILPGTFEVASVMASERVREKGSATGAEAVAPHDEQSTVVGSAANGAGSSPHGGSPAMVWQLARRARRADHDHNGNGRGSLGVLRRVTRIRPDDHASPDDECLEGFPDLLAALGCGSWDAIQPRMPGKLKIEAKGGLWYGRLDLPSEGQFIVQAGPTFAAMLSSLDAACRLGGTGWQELTWGPAVQKKRDLRKKALDTAIGKNDD